MTLAPFDPLVADVLMDPRTSFVPHLGGYLREGVLYVFTMAEVQRAEAYFLRLLKPTRPRLLRRQRSEPC